MGKATDTLIGIGGALLLVLAVVVSLNHKTILTPNDSNTSNVSVPATTPPSSPVTTTPAPVTTPPATSAQTTAPTTTKAPEITPETTAEPLEWTENTVSGTMYVNQSCYSRTRAIMGSDTVRGYSYGDVVNVVAVTDTGYYKLDNGEYIHGDYLSES
ncbi:MAG: hypothetical protein J6L61_10375 [Ruminiclostridium sp.]|nr:hypothetical protein [Ruminiclostridium sp.]